MTEVSDTAPEGISMEDWAGAMGERWLANLQAFEGTIAPVGEALLARAAYRPGERVLDIGFGGGASSLAIARIVAPGGEVLGIDISPDLVAATTRRAAADGLANARFICADAAKTDVPDGPYDRLCSRFGSMFFADPAAAFANLRRGLKPGGRIDLAVWAPPADNPWMSAVMALVRQYVDLPAPVPGTPGPFAFDNPDYLRSILTTAGFDGIEIEPFSGELPVGGPGSTPDVALAFAVNALSTGRLLQDQPDSIRQTVEADMMALYARHHCVGEGVMMRFAVWLVSATA